MLDVIGWMTAVAGDAVDAYDGFSKAVPAIILGLIGLAGIYLKRRKPMSGFHDAISRNRKDMLAAVGEVKSALVIHKDVDHAKIDERDLKIQRALGRIEGQLNGDKFGRGS